MRSAPERPSKVRRRPAPSFSRRNERPAPAWGDPIGRRIDWPLILFCAGWAIGFGVLLNLAFVRSGW